MMGGVQSTLKDAGKILNGIFAVDPTDGIVALVYYDDRVITRWNRRPES